MAVCLLEIVCVCVCKAQSVKCRLTHSWSPYACMGHGPSSILLAAVPSPARPAPPTVPVPVPVPDRYKYNFNFEFLIRAYM